MSEGLVYLASPYTHEDHAVEIERFETAARFAAAFIEAGLYVYSPIVHNHPIRELCGLPGDYDFWQGNSKAFLRRASRFIILQMDGWKESQGIQAEVAIAIELGLTIEYFPVASSLYGRKTNAPEGGEP